MNPIAEARIEPIIKKIMGGFLSDRERMVLQQTISLMVKE